MMNRFRPREFGEIRIDMVDREITESEMETWLTEMLAVHHRTILKAPVIGTMVLFSVATFSGSVMKGLLIGAVCLAAAAFSTWRRHLEPIAFWVFLLAIVFWCDPSLMESLKSGATQVSQLVLSR